MNNDVQYVYTVIPKDWIGLCQTIYYLYTEYGLEAIKECKISCDKRVSHIIDCYNIFNAAVTAYNSGRDKEANLIIKYLKEQMKIYYPNMPIGDKKLYIGSGFTYEDIITDEHLIDGIQSLVGSYQIDVASYNYMFFIFSPQLTYTRLTFNGFDIPCDTIQTIFIDDEPFKLLKTTNTYQAGSYIVKFE